jgi:tetratricopeptide (TPR) repeat protein
MSDRLSKLESMLEKNPRDPFLHYGIGMERKKLRQFAQAIEAFQAAIAVDPGYAYAYYQIGQTLELAGDPAGAKQAYEAGVESARRAGDRHAQSELELAIESLAG